MAGEVGESHAKVIIVAGPRGTRGIMSQDLERFGRLYKSQTLLIMINSDQCGVCFFSSTVFSKFSKHAQKLQTGVCHSHL